jgi:putative phosphoribosyl transferase
VVVRKLRTPQNPELGFGAVGADGHVEVEEATVERLGITEEQVEAEIADRRAAVSGASPCTGPWPLASTWPARSWWSSTTASPRVAPARQACAFARRNGAATVILAVPVAPVDAAQLLADAADDVVVLSTPAEFMGVSQAYAEFEQLDDDAAVAALRSVSRTV